MQRKDIRANGMGAYITAYKRPTDEVPLLDLNFFDGDRSIEEAVETARRMEK